MDFLNVDSKYFYVLSQTDCIEIGNMGYSYFELIFSESDWNYIVDFPRDGLSFFHSTPIVEKYLKISCDKSKSYFERREMLFSLKNGHEFFMKTNNIDFPDSDSSCIFDNSN